MTARDSYREGEGGRGAGGCVTDAIVQRWIVCTNWSNSFLKCTKSGFWKYVYFFIVVFIESRFQTQSSIMHSVNSDITGQLTSRETASPEV